MLPDRTRPPAYAQTFELDLRQVERLPFTAANIFAMRADAHDVVKIEFIFPHGGSRNDRLPGQSYMTWKMLSQGTRSRDAQAVAEAFDQYGGFLEANPSLDDPSFSLYCLSSKLDQLLPLLREVIQEPAFPEDELALNRDIIRQQIRVQNSRNSVVASKLFRQNLFGENHPYGKVLEEDHLTGITHDVLESFYRERAGKPDILISGHWEDRHIEQLAAIVEGEYTSQKSNPPDMDLPRATEIYEEKESSLQSSLRIGLVTIPKTHPDFIPLKISCHALGGYFGSRLMKNIREDKGYTYGIHSTLVTLDPCSYLTIGADVQKAFRNEAVQEIFHEISRLAGDEMQGEELQMVKNHLLGSFQSSITSPFSLADKFKSIHYHGLDYGYYSRYIDTIQSITAEKIKEMIATYLRQPDMTTVMVG